MAPSDALASATGTRRDFLATGTGAMRTIAGAPAVWTRRDDYDLVIRGGTVYDGGGGAGREADVAVRGDRIAAIGPRLRDKGRRELDARGLVVAPGFLDIHSHGEGNLWDDPRGESLVRQGITTIVAGQDGSSRAWGEGAAAGAESGSFAAWFAALDKLQPAVDVAAVIGGGAVGG